MAYKRVTYECNIEDSFKHASEYVYSTETEAISPVSSYMERVLSKMELAKLDRFLVKIKGIVMTIDYTAPPNYNRPYTED